MGLGIRTYLANKLRERRAIKFGDGYVDWRARRQMAIVDHYGAHFFYKTTFLELGAGYGDTGAFFSGLGALVTCVEGRSEHTRVIQERHPHIRSITCDLSKSWPTGLERHDIIMHMGVLYHLDNPEENLRSACRVCNHLILETVVCDSDDPDKVLFPKELSYCYDQAVGAHGSRPSPAFIERVLEFSGMRFQRITDARCNSGDHVYDWTPRNTGQSLNGHRAMWFAEKIDSRTPP